MLQLKATAPDAALPWALAWRLAFGQVVAWGVLYYAFTVVVGPMQAATGWSRAFLNAGVSVGFLAWGLCAFPVGVWIHRQGARGLMTVASGVGGLALASLAIAPSPAGYILSWMLLGASMAGLLYEPAFAVIAARFGSHYPKGITIVTLVGGLASTVFVPVAHGLVSRVGWQHALLGLGVFQALFGAGMHWFGVPPHCPPASGEPVVASPAWFRAFLLSEWRDRRLIGLAVCFAAHAAAFSGTMMLLVPVVQQTGLSNDAMLGAIMLMGPMQVIGRLALMGLDGRHSALRLARGAMGVLILSLALVTLLPPTFAVLATFAILYGAANGVMTILRGTSVAEIFGRDRYPLLSGALALPSVLAKAAAPWLLAGLWEQTGAYRVVFGGALLFVAIGAVGLGVAMTRPPAVRPAF